MSNEFTDSDFAGMLSAMEDESKQGQYVSPYWKPSSDGTFKIRIITPLKQFNEKLFYEKHKLHYINNRTYFCLNQTLKDKNGNIHEAEACPICAKSKQLYSISQKGSEEWTIAGQLRAKDRYVSRIIVRGKKDKDGKDDEATPEFWEFGSKIHGYFFDAIKMGEVGNFLSLKEGRDYNLVKKGTGRNTDYSGSCLSMQTSPIFSDPEKLKKLLAELPKMEYSQLVEFASADEMKQALADFSGESVVENSAAPAPADDLDPMSQAVSVNPAPAQSDADKSIDDLLNMI